MVWLELDTYTGLYHKEGEVSKADSQGWFAFGKACANAVLKAGGVNNKLPPKTR